MSGTASRRVALVFLAFAAGCTSPKSSSTPVVVKEEKGPSKLLTDDQSKASEEFLGNLFAMLNEGKLTADRLHPRFKSIVAPPRPNNDADKATGYDASKLEAYLKTVNSGAYAPTFIFTPSPTGPYISGEVAAPGGDKESYIIHLKPDDAGKTWIVDWLQRSKALSQAQPIEFGLEFSGAPITVQAFADNLFGGEPLLAAALLTDACKKNLYPDATGFNQPLLMQKLRDWKGSTPSYTFSCPEYVPGKPAKFEVVTLDVKQQPKKVFGLTVARQPAGEWLIESIEEK